VFARRFACCHRRRFLEGDVAHLDAGPNQDVPAFEYGLDLLLESLERLR
jgi:hypothetical protein